MATEFQLALVTPDESRDYVLKVDELVILPRYSQLTTPISHDWAAVVYATHYDPLTKAAVVVCNDIKMHPDSLEFCHARLLAGGWDVI